MNNKTRILIGSTAILMGGYQIFKAVSKDKVRKEHKSLIEQISDQQLQENIENQKENHYAGIND